MPAAPRLILMLAAALVAGSLALLAASGPGYTAGYWSLPGGFRLLRTAAVGGLAGGLLALTSLRWRRTLSRGAWVALAGILTGAMVASAVPAAWARTGQTVPSINDITPTRTIRRSSSTCCRIGAAPGIRRTTPARRWPRSSAPPGRTSVLSTRRWIASASTRLAREVMTRAGWRIVGDDAAAGRLEAIATTRWFRFKDDIVVRLARSGRRRHPRGRPLEVADRSQRSRHQCPSHPHLPGRSAHGPGRRPVERPAAAVAHRSSRFSTPAPIW